MIYRVGSELFHPNVRHLEDHKANELTQVIGWSLPTMFSDENEAIIGFVTKTLICWVFFDGEHLLIDQTSFQ